MDKRTENRYLKIKKDQKRILEDIRKKEEEFELLKIEEEEIAGQEILAVCEAKEISLIDAIGLFAKNKKEEKIFSEKNKETGIYEN